MKLIYPVVCLSVLVLCGCEKKAGSADLREEREPLIQSGQEYMDARNYEQAEAAFLKALEKDPALARPHLDLALIYQQYKINYIHAIYHYDRYLELRPDSEKRALIEEQKIKVARQLAEALVRSSPDVKQMASENQRLRQENNALQQQIVSLKKLASDAASAAAVSVPRPAVEAAPTVKAQPAVNSDAPEYEIYTVVAGDTLSKIATKFYGTGDWEPIYEANKDRMKSPGDLRIGQTLVVPKR